MNADAIGRAPSFPSGAKSARRTAGERVSLHRRASHRSNDSRVHERAENDERERKNAHASRARERDARETRSHGAGAREQPDSAASSDRSRATPRRASRTLARPERSMASISTTSARLDRSSEMNAAESGRKQISQRARRRRVSRRRTRLDTPRCRARVRTTRTRTRGDHLSHLDVLARDVLETHATRPHDGVPLVILAIRRVDTVGWTLRISAIDPARTRTRASLLVGHARVPGRRIFPTSVIPPSRASDVSRTRRRRDSIPSILGRTNPRRREESRDRIDRHSAPSRARGRHVGRRFVRDEHRERRRGTSGRRGNPRARTVARTSKKGWRGGGGRAREGGSARAMGGQGEETRAGGLERARGRWWDVVGGWTSGRGWRARKKLSASRRGGERTTDRRETGEDRFARRGRRRWV